MALVRCRSHGKPSGKVHQYSDAPYEPAGHPSSGLICGLCQEPGFVWLDADEENTYHDGERIFKLPTGSVKVRVK